MDWETTPLHRYHDVRFSDARPAIGRNPDAIGEGEAAAFDGRFPGNTTDLKVMAASWPSWHTRCPDASGNGEGHAWRGRSHTRSPCRLLTLLTRLDYPGQLIGRPSQHGGISLMW